MMVQTGQCCEWRHLAEVHHSAAHLGTLCWACVADQQAARHSGELLADGGVPAQVGGRAQHTVALHAPHGGHLDLDARPWKHAARQLRAPGNILFSKPERLNNKQRRVVPPQAMTIGRQASVSHRDEDSAPGCHIRCVADHADVLIGANVQLADPQSVSRGVRGDLQDLRDHRRSRLRRQDGNIGNGPSNVACLRWHCDISFT